MISLVSLPDYIDILWKRGVYLAGLLLDPCLIVWISWFIDSMDASCSSILVFIFSNDAQRMPINSAFFSESNSLFRKSNLN